MDDHRIVELYLMRQEDAIDFSQKKYGKMLYSLAVSLLHEEESAKECENDTYFTAWQRIPPDHPQYLGGYLAKITRYICMNMIRKRKAIKRPEIFSLSEELTACIPDESTVEGSFEKGRLKEALEKFLDGLSPTDRHIFLRRYFFGNTVEAISENTGFSRANVRVRLFRTRERLKNFLREEEIL